MNQPFTVARAQFLTERFSKGVPPLWCPPLTHYTRQGALDASRMVAHLRHLSSCVGGLLIPGSTGDGWELTGAERRQVLAIGLEQAQRLDLQVLIGALKPDADETMALICQDMEWLKAQFGESDAAKALHKAHVCGFTVCPPRGSELTQEQIGRALSSVLELGLPTAIYQLPQVTLNQMSSELAAELALRFENFIFFKDTSGADAVVLSGKSLAGIFTARGAEGDYARWLKAAGGRYDGFLLASANCFAWELYQVITDIAAGRLAAAGQLSERLTAAVSEMFGLAATLPHGNPFTNANKALDHFFAHGPSATTVPPPRLHAGTCLPLELIYSTGEILSRLELMPAKGYLD